MSTNQEDIKRGRELLESGEAVRYDELHEGDMILGVGEVSYVHVFNGGEYVRVLIAPDHGGMTEGEVFNTIKRAELKVTIEPRASLSVTGISG